MRPQFESERVSYEITLGVGCVALGGSSEAAGLFQFWEYVHDGGVEPDCKPGT